LLAERQIFEFSKSKMVDGLEILCPEQVNEIRLLSDLRLLNAAFFSATESITLQGLPTIESAVQSLCALIKHPVLLTEKPYALAVSEFIEDTKRKTVRLGYRLRTWFLLLVYDGISLFCKQRGLKELTNLSETTIIAFTAAEFPSALRYAAIRTLDYLHNYPLKYFLLEESKIPVEEACSAVVGLLRLVTTDVAAI